MAEALLDTVLGSWRKMANRHTRYWRRYKGKDLEYKEYEPLYRLCTANAAAKQNKKAFYVTCDTYVTLTDGTGVVHIAPAFGEDDCQGRKKI